MNVNLPLSPERQATLERRAAASGTDLPGYILKVVEEDLELSEDSDSLDLPYEKWEAVFDEWLASHRSRNPQVDDSRESIYD